MVNESRILNEFLELVQIGSESYNERRIADVLIKKLTDLGLDVFEDDSNKKSGLGAGNLICNLKGNVDGVEPFLFSCHMDTVVPGIGVKPSVKDGYVISDGTTILGADDKAGVAVMLETIRVLKENKLQHGDIQFVISCGEEVGLLGAKNIDTSRLFAKFGYAIDSSGKFGNLVIGAPTQAHIVANLYGKTAHAGVAPHKGISAIVIAARAIANMPHGRIDYETTANIGKIIGGTATNIVADHVVVYSEARSLDKEKMMTQVETMKQAFEKAALEMGGHAEVQFDVIYGSYKLNDDNPIVQRFKNAASKVGIQHNFVYSGGGSDANIFNNLGIPTANIAVGYEDVHTKNERMPIQELYKLVELVIAIIDETVKEL